MSNRWLCRLGMHKMEVHAQSRWFDHCFCVRCGKREMRLSRA